MASHSGLSTESSFSEKLLFALRGVVASPRATISWVFRGHLAKDAVFVSHSYWFTGDLPRAALNAILPRIHDIEIVLPRAFDRTTGKTASISVEEACHLAAMAQLKHGGRALEIGTADGNTALLLAANLGSEGSVVTVDLPPDFNMERKQSLTYSEGDLNLTPRDALGRQYRGHALECQVTQVYGDSAKLDWRELGGPFDLIFIDGSHIEPYVRSDSENAMKHLAPGGMIVWHDYAMIRAVSDVVDAFAREYHAMKMYALEGTRLAIGLT
jgi:predicted O-methyltransferase YrrM